MKRFLPLALLLTLVLLAASSGLSARSQLTGRFETVTTETDIGLYGVRNFDGKTIYFCGREGSLVQTRDGGKTWNVKEMKEDISFRVMSWFDTSHGILTYRKSGTNYLYITRNGGQTFNNHKLKLAYPIRDIVFLDRRRAWAVAGSRKQMDGGWVFTKDGGKTWVKPTSIAYGIPGRALYAIAAVGKKLWAVGSHVEVSLVGEQAKSLLYQKHKGAVLYSDDEGKTWDVQKAGNPTGSILLDVDFVDEKNGFVVGDRGFAARTTDGGKTWQKLSTGTTRALNAVSVLSAKSAFLVGDKGTALVTTDGGKSFNKLATGTEDNLRDVSFVDEGRGWTVGPKASMLKFKRSF